jgi:hypothetical protein
MSVDEYGDHGEPIFGPTPSTRADMAAITSFAKTFGNLRFGTSTQRQALTGNGVWDGLWYNETDTHDVYIYDGPLGDWRLYSRQNQAFTPTFSGGVTVGNGTRYGRYTITNFDVLDLEFTFQLGSTSDITGIPSLTLPDNLTLNTINGAWRFPLGNAIFYDASENYDLYGVATVSTNTSIRFRNFNGGDDQTTTVNNNVDALFPWATGDQISANIRARLSM